MYEDNINSLKADLLLCQTIMFMYALKAIQLFLFWPVIHCYSPFILCDSVDLIAVCVL